MKLSFIFTIATFFFSFLVNAQIDVSLDDHNEAIGLYNEALVIYKQRQYSSAIPKLKAVIALDPSIRDAQVCLIQSMFNTEEYAPLKNVISKAKEVFEEDDEFFYYSGLLFQNEGKLDDAIKEFNMAIEYSKINGEDYPLVYAYYSNRASVYLKKNQFSEAISDYKYALKLNNTKSSVYSNLGYALYKTDEINEACIHWKKAVELGDTAANKYILNHCK